MSDRTNMQERNVLVGCTGSVASIKIPLLVTELQKNENHKVNIKIIATEHACHFFDPATTGVNIYRDADEWDAWKQRSDPVLHIELRRWADLLIIAPLDANTLAKIAGGICDNLLTCVVRAWDIERPLLFAPAMNTHMWTHPLTAKHVASLQSLGYKEIPCISKTLVCGDTGLGAMAEVNSIIEEIDGELSKINS